MKNTVNAKLFFQKQDESEITDQEFTKINDAFFRLADKLSLVAFGELNHIKESELGEY